MTSAAADGLAAIRLLAVSHEGRICLEEKGLGRTGAIASMSRKQEG